MLVFLFWVVPGSDQPMAVLASLVVRWHGLRLALACSIDLAFECEAVGSCATAGLDVRSSDCSQLQSTGVNGFQVN
jgi:hypothetical protein